MTRATGAHAAIAAPALAPLAPARRQPRPSQLLSPHHTLLRGPVEPKQYTSADYTQVLDDHQVLASIGSVGDALDNAMAESFVDSYKTELIADRVWRCRAQLELATVEWVGWYNHDRLHERLGDIPPVEHEQRHALAEPVDPPFSGDRSVAGVSPRAADRLRTRRFSTPGVDLAADSPIDAVNASAARSAPAQAAQAVVTLPTPAARLSDLRFREILADNNNQTKKEPT